MAKLTHLGSHAGCELTGHDLVGRSPLCGLRLFNPLASSKHAVLFWSGEAWQVRDLGSSNGTWIDGRLLSPNRDYALEPDMVLAFGDANDRWNVDELRPPVARVECEDGAWIRADEEGVVAIPTVEKPEITVWREDDGRWVALLGGDLVQVEDGQVVKAQGRTYRLHLPR